jgi:V/A-type H+-transporting ATPase subunit D
MAKIKFTKGELKKQRDSLKQFKRYLPTLILKKQQLQMKILEARRLLKERMAVLKDKEKVIASWVGLLSDPTVDLTKWLTPIKVETDIVNIAGAKVPIFKQISFEKPDYDYYEMPFWIDKGIEELRLLIELLVEVEILKKQIELLEQELRTTTQRVNLFEKVKIPECIENIRKISIYLGDQQANAVGISKVAKKKVEERNLEESLT